MAITTPASGELRLALDEILVRENVRDLDDAHVDNLAQSIALRGLLVPLIVRPTDAGYELVAGYHRLAACRKLDLPDVPASLEARPAAPTRGRTKRARLAGSDRSSPRLAAPRPCIALKRTAGAWAGAPSERSDRKPSAAARPGPVGFRPCRCAEHLLVDFARAVNR